MKQLTTIFILVFFDLVAVTISIALGYELRLMLNGSLPIIIFEHDIDHYLSFPPLYFVPILMLAYEEVYTKRSDFWQESKRIIKALLISFAIIFAILALSKSVTMFSRLTLTFSITFMIILIPIMKIIVKKMLFKFGLWQKKARVHGCDVLVRQEVFKNWYLGYVDAKDDDIDSIFINAKDMDIKERNKLISEALLAKNEVIFIPTFDEFDLTKSHVDKLENTRTNLIYFKNRLASSTRMLVQVAFNYTLAILILPILLPIIGVLAFLIKKESPGPVFFAHKRVGKGGKLIPTYKFRSMYSDASERLEKLLKENPEVKQEWEKNFKLKDDPRVTKIGAILRKTSLDELPQIFNVLRGEMNFVGPRPVIQEEIDQYYKDDTIYYAMVKPGITGLWQVSGRSDTDYEFRVATDKWYVTNWSLWQDIVILFKTVKVVLFREGAY